VLVVVGTITKIRTRIGIGFLVPFMLITITSKKNSNTNMRSGIWIETKFDFLEQKNNSLTCPYACTHL
jgi:hypothetical protein